MRKLVPYWFAPIRQPVDGVLTEFEIRPLDQETLYTLQSSFGDGSVPKWAGIKAAFEYGVVGWRNVSLEGAPVEFSRKNAAQILKQPGTADWMIWLGSIAGELYRNAFLEEEEKKT